MLPHYYYHCVELDVRVFIDNILHCEFSPRTSPPMAAGIEILALT